MKSNNQRAATPWLAQGRPEIQSFGTIALLPIGLTSEVCQRSVQALNQILADTMALRDLYKKHHWQVSGPTFFQLHQLFDKHYTEQAALVDLLAERIQLLGGVSVAMAQDIAETTTIERPPRGREDPPAQITRLLEAHQRVLQFCHEAAAEAQDSGDDGTNDLLVSNAIRTNEFHVWFLAQHLLSTPVADPNAKAPVLGANESGKLEVTKK